MADYHECVIEAFDLPAEAARAGELRFSVRVLASPAGEMRPSEAALLTLDARQLQDDLNRLEQRALDREALIAFGQRLTGWLLPPRQPNAEVGVRALLDACRTQAGQDGAVRLRLRLSPALARIPWEYLYLDPPGGSGLMDGFLALNPQVAIVRHEALPAAIPSAQPPGSEALRVRAALALAQGDTPLDLAAERDELGRIFEARGVEHAFIEQATIEDLLEQIPDAHIFHFAGHGEFQSRRVGARAYIGVGEVALAEQRVDSERLSLSLRGNALRLVVLGACETARRGGERVVNPWGAVAPMLAKAGVPAVVASQYTIADRCAIAFSRGFYQALFGGMSIERAVTAGRLAIYNADPASRDWGVPALYMRASHGQILAGVADPQTRAGAAQAAEAMISRARQSITQIQTGGINFGVNTTIGRMGDAIDGDKVVTVEGDMVHGDKIAGDDITVGDISGSSGIAIGAGARATVDHTYLERGVDGATIQHLLSALQRQVEQSGSAPTVKGYLQQRLHALGAAAQSGPPPIQQTVDRELALLARMGSDVITPAQIAQLRSALLSGR